MPEKRRTRTRRQSKEVQGGFDAIFKRGRYADSGAPGERASLTCQIGPKFKLCTRSAGTELKGQVPPHAQHDDFLIEVSPLEEILCRRRFDHAGPYRLKA